jgi:hypothetical protein
MFDSWVDVLQVAACGGVGGFIYWAAREHGRVFVTLWNHIRNRDPIPPR